jgi:hypothetical protein
MFRLLGGLIFVRVKHRLPVAAVVIGGLHSFILTGLGNSSSSGSILDGPTTLEIL